MNLVQNEDDSNKMWKKIKKKITILLYRLNSLNSLILFSFFRCSDTDSIQTWLLLGLYSHFLVIKTPSASLSS